MRTRKKRMTILLAAAAAVSLLFGKAPSDGSGKASAAGRPVAIASCLIAGTDVVCEIRASAVPASDDGKYYLYADEVYQDGPTGSIVATVETGRSVTASFPLSHNTADSNLSRKFLVAVKSGGQMVQVSDEHYITNPEAIAGLSSPRMNTGIKGILPDVERITSGEVAGMGIRQVIYNMHLDDICSAAAVPGAVPFEYNGQTWYFDGAVLSN